MSEYKRLDELCYVNMGQSPSSNSYNDCNDGIPFFQGNADFGKLYPTVRLWCNEPTKIVEPGTLLISVRAPIGALNFSAERSCIGRGLAGIVPKDGIDSKYIYYFLKSKKDELERSGTGSTFKAISKGTLAAVKIKVIPEDEQRKVVQVLDKICDIIDSRKQQIEELDTLVKARFVEGIQFFKLALSLCNNFRNMVKDQYDLFLLFWRIQIEFFIFVISEINVWNCCPRKILFKVHMTHHIV